MRVHVTPEQVELQDDGPVTVSVTVTNTSTIIGGYHLRVLGADPGWVSMESENLSLFPETSQTVAVRIDIPAGIGAGDRRIAIQVRELTPPRAITVSEIELVIPPREALKFTLSPMTVLCGRSGRFGLIVENTGNTTVLASPRGLDPEQKIRFEVTPPVLELAPGDHAIADLRVAARRRWFGSPVVRPFAVAAVPPDAPPRTPGPDGTAPAEPAVEPLANGTMMQKPRLGRGVLSLLSLLVAISVFAVVITIAMSRLAGVSAADRDLALEVAAAADASAVPSGNATIGGVLRQLTDGGPAAGVTVEVFEASSLTHPVASTATDDTGAFAVSSLPAGSYKVRFRGAGMPEIWYPNALSGTDAQPITLQSGQERSGMQIALGGLPASVSGEIIGDDVAGSVLTVQVPADRLIDSAGENEPGAVLRSVPIAADGRFSLTDIASPGVYDLVVSKPGFATETQRIDLAGGETRAGVQLRLRTGDGLIAGTVTGPDGPVGGAVVTATTGSTTVRTVSLTEQTPGAFTLRGLITPGTYTVSISADGYAPQSTTLTLTPGQHLAGVRLGLDLAAGSLSGHVTTIDDGQPAPGVTVTVASGETTLTTVTQSAGDVGGWTVAGLPIPGTYTVTLSRTDLQSQTVSVSLDRAGNASTGGNGIDVGMRSAFGSVSGTVSQRAADGDVAPVGEATVVLSSGTDTYTVTSASVPVDDRGAFVIDGVRPGTYTLSVTRRGTSPTTVTLTVEAGQQVSSDPVLIPAAGISGRVTDRHGGSVSGLTVELFESSQYPADVYASTVTDAEGNYRFENIDAPQAYVVQVRSGTAGVLGSATVVLAASQAGQLNLEIGGSAPATEQTGGTR